MRYFFSLIFLLSCVSICLAQEGYQYPYSALKERDPFRPLISDNGDILIREKREQGNFLIQGIIYSGQESTVVINNEIYTAGDIIDGYTIKKIEPYEVIFDKDGIESVVQWEE
jgi:type II secretory pathway component PulC